MPLRDETVEQIVAMWEAIVRADDERLDGVELIEIAGRRLTTIPPHLRDRVGDCPVDLDEVTARLGDEVERVAGIARLAYADANTATLPDPVPVVAVADDDPRLAALGAAADATEWQHASVGEPCRTRVGIADGDTLLAVATLEDWRDVVGHIGVFTRADARKRGLAGTVGAAVVRDAFERGLIAQWRSDLPNLASAAVADRLGFVPLGVQLYVRVRPHTG